MLVWLAPAAEESLSAPYVQIMGNNNDNAAHKQLLLDSFQSPKKNTRVCR